MEMKSIQLRPGDVAIAMELAISADRGLTGLASAVFRSLGEVHNAMGRLRAAHLLKPMGREVAIGPLTNFIRWGVPHAFPAVVGGLTTGIATARLDSAGQQMDPSVSGATVEFVWPDSSGPSHGQALEPLYPNARKLVAANRELYSLLSLTDLIRIGGAREANAAITAISRRLTQGSRPADEVGP